MPTYGMPLLEAAEAAGLDIPEPAEPVDRTVRANGLNFHYLDWGNDHLPPLLFTHGFAQQAHSWDFASLMFRDRFHVISLDLRGHGDSDWAPDGSYMLSDYVSDLAGIVDELGLESVAIGGHSLGGRVAFIYASQHVAVVNGLIVVDVGPHVSKSGSSRIRDFVQGQDEWDSFEDLVEHVYKFTGGLRKREQIMGSVQRAAKQMPDGRWTWRYDRVLRGERKPDPMWDTERLWAALRGVKCPMLLVRGALSDVLSPEAAEAIIAAVPGSEQVVVENAEHRVPGDNPAGFAEAVNPFLNRLLAG